MKTRKQTILNLEEELVGLRYRELAMMALYDGMSGITTNQVDTLVRIHDENVMEMKILQKTIELLKTEEGA
ncbi:MAG: hypothetical protein [Caudoviricetes sp.]|nr:MAG: hypothetical protein [Caudoviricetes sp.]